MDALCSSLNKNTYHNKYFYSSEQCIVNSGFFFSQDNIYNKNYVLSELSTRTFARMLETKFCQHVIWYKKFCYLVIHIA